MAFLPVQWQALAEKTRAVRGALTPMQLVSLAGVFVAVLGLLVGSTWYLNQTEYRVLFSDLSAESASQVVDRLQADDVAFQLADGGRTVLVPAGSIDALRLRFAADGMPESGRIGFELFDRTAFGQTEFLEHVNYRRALEGELARTISTLSDVQHARVHIAMAKESLFGSREQPAKASVVLTLKGNRTLPGNTTQAITSLVAAGVEGLRPEQVVIVDSFGRALARGAASEDEAPLAGAELERQQKYERDMAVRVVALLEPVVGVERVRVNVSARLHGESEEQTEERWDPSPVVRSRQMTAEGGNTTSAQGVAGARANLPPVVQPDGTPGPPLTPPATVSVTPGLTKTSEVTNYEVGKLTRHSVRPRGELARLSVAVIVDDEHQISTAQDGVVTMKRTPREPAEMQKLQKLVAAAVGIDTERGDQITVENIAFDAPVAAPVEAPAWWQPVSDHGGGLARGLAVLLIVGMVLLLFVRPVVARLLTVSEHVSTSMRSPHQLPRTIEDIEGEIEAQLDAGGEGSDRRQPVLARRVTKLASKEPESAAKLVRGWLTEGRS